ncbi:hypothetical protein [Pseudomonas caricapapayae]|uniref:hypothetical protein n=1 Tax=Pseudomonas caricapapayae TaxID=46678 RepID=UPI001F486DE7|nr:hypothetical protein [Pseudomonas caricapapayae]
MEKNILLEVGGERTLEDPSRIAFLMSRFDVSDDRNSGVCFVKGCIEGSENERESVSVSFEDTNIKGFNLGFNIDAYQGEPNLPLSDRTPSIPDLEPRGKPGVKGAFAHGQNAENAGKLINYCKEGKYNNSVGYKHQNAYTDEKGRTLYATLYSLVRLSENS